jgi:hypothetical protein
MKTYFKPAHLAASIALALGAATTTLPVQAVTLSDNNLGDVAVVPFYSTRGLDTYLSIVNTSARFAVAVKIRFREADNSRDARDFTIVLSKNDVWTAVVTMGEDGETPIIKTTDTSCTAPALPAVNDTQRGIGFTNIDYNGGTGLGQDAEAPEQNTIARTQDGHFEIIMMGVSEEGDDVDGDRNIAGYATHDSGYFNCNTVARAMVNVSAPTTGPDGETLAPATFEFGEPLNVMKVAANLIDIDGGTAAMIPVTMLANFVNFAPDGSEDLGLPLGLNSPGQNILFNPQDDRPNLNSGVPATSTQIINGALVDSIFLRPVDAVSSLLMAIDVLNEYAVGGASLAANDWVVTFPTKNFYVDYTLVGEPEQDDAIPPFTDWFQDVFQVFGPGGVPAGYDWEPGDGVSCELVSFGYFDREEAKFTPDSPPEFSPVPKGTPSGSAICYETQTLQFGEASVLNGRNTYGVPLEDGFTSGWMRLQFLGEAANIDGLVSDNGNTFYGLPVLSFGVKAYTNGVSNEGGILNYGFTQPAAFTRDVD